MSPCTRDNEVIAPHCPSCMDSLFLTLKWLSVKMVNSRYQCCSGSVWFSTVLLKPVIGRTHEAFFLKFLEQTLRKNCLDSLAVFNASFSSSQRSNNGRCRGDNLVLLTSFWTQVVDTRNAWFCFPNECGDFVSFQKDQEQRSQVCSHT